MKRMCTNLGRQNQNSGFNEFSPFSQYGKLTLNYGTRSKNKKEINDMIFINSPDYIEPSNWRPTLRCSTGFRFPFP